jgi:hypothetical protein
MNLLYSLDKHILVTNCLWVKEKYVHEIYIYMTQVCAVCDTVSRLWFIDVKGILNDVWYSYVCEIVYVVCISVKVNKTRHNVSSR